MKVSLRKNTKTLFLVLFIILSLCLVGCSQKEKGPEVHDQKNKNYVAEKLSNSEESSDLENMINESDLYFTKNYYATIYKPARCLYDSDKDYEEDLKLYGKYLKAVGSLDNTFEERFRGNVQIKTIISRNQSKKQVIVKPATLISVYSEEARNYLINTVLPEMGENGINVKMKVGYRTYDLRHDYERVALLEDLDYQAYKKYNVYDNSNKLPSVQWDLEVPQELVDIYGEYYKKYFNNANSPLTNNPFMQDKDFKDLSQTYYSFVEADEYLVIYDQYQFQMPLEHIYKELYRLLYSIEQKVEMINLATGLEEYGYYIEKNGELVPYTSSGFVAKDSKGKYIYDEEGFVTRKLYSTEQVEYDNLVIEGKLSSGSSESFTVTFKNWDGSILSSIAYEYGDTIVIPSNPTRPSDSSGTYIFIGWDTKPLIICLGNATYIAQYKVEQPTPKYEVTFKNWDGSILSTKLYSLGETIEIPNNPTRDSDNTYYYTFEGWNKEVNETCTGNEVYSAVFTQSYIEYIIVFKNWDGSIITQKTYHYGDLIEFPEEPIREADDKYEYKFSGWDTDVSNVTENKEITAQYTQIEIQQQKPGGCAGFNIIAFFNMLAMMVVIIVIRKFLFIKK